MNVIASTGRGMVHARAVTTTDTIRPLCVPDGTPGVTAYRTTDEGATCGRCAALPQPDPPQPIIDMRDVVLVTQMAAQNAYDAVRSARHVVGMAVPGGPSYDVAQAALCAAEAARRPTEQAWHAAVASFIVLSRLVRTAVWFPLDEIETVWAHVPEVAAAIAAHAPRP